MINEIHNLLKIENDKTTIFTNKELKMIDDYIKELELLQSLFEIQNDYIDKLEEENKKLNENYDRIYNENCILREKHNINDIGLLDENYKLKKVIDKIIEYIEYNNETLYTYEPNYDYEENIVDNYDISNYREDLLEILKGGENE